MARLAVQFEAYWQRCIECGIWFGVDKCFDGERRKSKQGFYCPNGHSQAYIESEADMLRKQLQQEQQRSAMEAASRRTAEEGRAKAEKELKRIKMRTQIIRARALRFLQMQRSEQEFPEHYGFKNVTGVALPENEAARRMDAFVADHPALKEFGMTGAMHQYGIAHGKALFEIGWDRYEKELREAGRTDEDFFEFDEKTAFPEDETEASK